MKDGSVKPKVIDAALPIGVYSKVVILQESESSKLYFKVFFNDTEVHSREAFDTRQLNDLPVYIGSPWHKPAHALIRDFVFSNPESG